MKMVAIFFLGIVVLVGVYAVFNPSYHWSKSYSQKAKGLSVKNIWRIWSDINNWDTWQNDIEYAKLKGAFEVGNTFILKPTGVSEVTIELVEVNPNKSFTDLTKFPLAKMFGRHEFIQNGDELEIKTTITVEGFLGFVWRKLVAEDVANGMKQQTENLIKKAQDG